MILISIMGYDLKLKCIFDLLISIDGVYIYVYYIFRDIRQIYLILLNDSLFVKNLQS